MFKDEFSRRIVIEFGYDKLDNIRNIVKEISKSAVFEVKILCHNFREPPKGDQFKWRFVGRRTAYGIVLKRYVFAEITKRSLVLKLGKPSKTENPPSILPASAFQFSVDEVEEAIGMARKIAVMFRGIAVK